MTLEAIGQKLKAAREGQGLSLRQIYERTKIPINHLQAIDSGQPDDLPEPVYVAGFIKRYAECIGLDGQVLADEYRRTDSNGNGRPNMSHPAPVYATHEYLRHTKIDSGPPSYKLWPFYAIALFGLIALISWYSSHSKDNQVQPTESLKDSMSQMQQQQGQTTQAATVAGNAAGTSNGATDASATPDSANANKITLSANEHVWVTVKRLASGESIYTGLMEQGEHRSFEDPQGIRVTAGKGGSLSVEFKGKIEPFGKPGTRTERTFSTSGAATATTGQPGSTAAANGANAAKGLNGASAATSSNSANSSGTATSTGHATGDSKPKKIAPKLGNTTTHRWQGEDGSRSIPGNDGMRSIDVPYRYSDGHQDPN
jgi:cytoskeletal protein RodZ